ncbi:NADH-quinone oxidoreductase subunit J [Hyperthermus butylicus]|uniref:NADH-quinone oxidoreductase subunit J n=1 Tax=Hyperthermus butylicus (strain DSM 5456 / JCM 9403 / PLM1-5) TaxID=415426 RepID=A2BJ99_HYPBU|nr:NADH-quinone oxidoreductase subunit J [Hyperthermus butylicus]ABM80060.1 hypothetical protein Hbut_0188 [Hyperthermus butylicus DSM 5456]
MSLSASLESVLYYSVLLGSLATVAVGSIAAVRARKTIYSILGLVTLALGVSAVFALHGYTYLAVFILAIYVGAGVTLIALVVMVTGYYRIPVQHSPAKLLLAFIAAAALQAPVLVYGAAHNGPEAVMVDLRSVAADMFKCKICIVVIIITIASVLVEAIAIARGEARKSSQVEGKPTHSV